MARQQTANSRMFMRIRLANANGPHETCCQSLAHLCLVARIGRAPTVRVRILDRGSAPAAKTQYRSILISRWALAHGSCAKRPKKPDANALRLIELPNR